MNQSAPQKNTLLDVNIINPFIEATQATLEKQAQTKCVPQKAYLVGVNEKSYPESIAIAGVISISTDKFTGTIALAFPERVFLGIYSSMFGEKVDKINTDIEDAAGEILNIIYGSAKTKLNATMGMKLAPALPAILSGEKIQIRQKTHQKLVVLPFETPHGGFQIEISFDSNT